MISRLRAKSEFSKNTLTLMIGSALAQVIPILISPILTRVYTPEEFGIFALYIAFISIGASLVTAKYETAILLPKKEENAKYLVYISSIFALFFSLLFLIVYLVFDKQLNDFFKVTNSVFYFVPFGIFLFAIYAILLQWANRKKEYKNMNKNRLIQSSSISIFQVLTGILNKISFGLIVSDVMGRVIAVLLILNRVLQQVKLENFSLKKAISLVRRYKKFPKYEMPATVLNITSYELVYIIIPIYFSSVTAGLYFLVFRVLMTPIGFIGSAITEVFKNRAIEDLNKYNSCRRIYKKIFLLLFSIGIFPLLIITIWGQPIFSFIFGEEWKEAGLYAQILAPLALFRLISSPLSYLFIIKEKLELDLLIQFIFFILVIGSLIIGSFYKDIYLLVSLLSLSGCIFYMIQIIISYRLSNGN
ncbi:lipopolysaccharide biosynthesis protein [Aliarcobacter cryaerophilus]|uniref:lipopolysaccharide biosynthesis protein n=1 Tax=Aliarcobacter cryaerophilus TaxID=28198 RepID=UPI0016540288|nr:oligosaccharide flippase family protein [Aliarcobacter cryaerophilus]QNM91527.1 oligosaccharide flippase family protein [Aliarcobacter cryaerophilus]